MPKIEVQPLLCRLRELKFTDPTPPSPDYVFDRMLIDGAEKMRSLVHKMIVEMLPDEDARDLARKGDAMAAAVVSARVHSRKVECNISFAERITKEAGLPTALRRGGGILRFGNMDHFVEIKGVTQTCKFCDKPGLYWVRHPERDSWVLAERSEELKVWLIHQGVCPKRHHETPNPSFNVPPERPEPGP